MPKVTKYKILVNNEEWLYTGNWKKSRPHGKGNATSFSGDKYSGEWLEGVRHGQGKYRWKDGSIFEGNFLDGEFHGHGNFIWPDGTIYTGPWLKGKMHGSGRLSWPNGDCFQGEFANDVKCGKGKLSWRPRHSIWNEILSSTEEKIDPLDAKNNQFYNTLEGAWANDLPNGICLRKTIGSTAFGLFRNGQLNGFAEVTYNDGSKYEGDFKDGLYSGYGIKINNDPEGYKYEGEWANGHPEGHGVMAYSNGTKYDGDWKAGVPHGRGFLFQKGKGVIEMDLQEGSFQQVHARYESEDSLARKCLEGEAKACWCITRAIKYRDNLSPTMFVETDYPFVKLVNKSVDDSDRTDGNEELKRDLREKQKQEGDVYFIGRDNFRNVKGTPAAKLNKR